MVVLSCASSQECSTECLLLESNEKLCHEVSSPQLLMTRLPKFKLNLDIPENNHDDENTCVIDDTIDFEEKPSEYLLDSSYDNGHMKITQNLSNLHSSIGFGDISQLTLISRSNSSASKLTTDDDLIRSSSSNSVESVNFIVNLPFDINFNSTVEEKKLSNEHIKLHNYHSYIHQWFYTTPFTKFSLIYDWVTRNFVSFITKSYDKFCYIFKNIYTPISRNKADDKKISDLVSIIRSENEYTLYIFGEKITNVLQELSQIRVTSEETLAILKHEINVLKDSNRELTDKNDILTKDVKNISSILETVQLNNSRSVTTETPTASVQSSAAKRSISLGEFMTPPPPPPPLPPPPTPLSLSAISKSTKKVKTGKTPTRKVSETSEKRPTITVEDLLKVTLKKAPQRNKENKRMNQAPQGPVVSLDMLKNVKLKSTRRRSYDKTVRSPLCTRKECRSQSFSLSPIMTGAVSPLSRILKQTDGNRRGLKRILMSSIQTNANEQTTKCPITQ